MSGAEWLSILLVAAVSAALFVGYPVALTLGGVSLLFAALAWCLDMLPTGLLSAWPPRIFGIMTSETLLAIPLFIFMGVMLERSRVAEDLLEAMGRLFGTLRGGLGIAVVLVGVLLAAAKGVVGATTVTMGLIVLPTMLRSGYDPRLAAGTVAATATLAQIFPPATVLILLGDQIANSWQAVQLSKGNYAPSPVTVADLFAGAIVPGLALVTLYIGYLVLVAWLRPASCPPIPPAPDAPRGLKSVLGLMRMLVLPLSLIGAVLGAILFGVASPTEASAIGAAGAVLLALLRGAGERGFATRAAEFWKAMRHTAGITSMIFVILIGATLFSLVFRGLGGDGLVARALDHLPGGPNAALIAVMAAIFLLGFVMDAFEIIFVIVPIVAPPLLAMGGIDPIWLGVMIAVNLQTSYMHPPLGPTLFFLKGVAPPELTTRHIYVGIIPFVLIQLVGLAVLWFVPALATALPHALLGR